MFVFIEIFSHNLLSKNFIYRYNDFHFHPCSFRNIWIEVFLPNVSLTVITDHKMQLLSKHGIEKPTNIQRNVRNFDQVIFDDL